MFGNRSRKMCDLFINKGILSHSFSLFTLTNLLLLTIGIPKAQTSCPSENSTEKCSSGYRFIKGSCTACIGFVGADCSHPCSPGYYGQSCKSSCNCLETQECNQFVGCISTGNATKKDKNQCCENNRDYSLGEMLYTCRIWQVAGGLIGIQVLELIAFIGYLLRRKLIWSRNLEINVKGTVGHFRLKKDDSIAGKIIERGERTCTSIKYDSHLLRREEASGDTRDVYNHIHFKRVTKVQNSSDKYDVIQKQYQRRKDYLTEPRDVTKTLHVPDSASNKYVTENQGIDKLVSNV